MQKLCSPTKSISPNIHCQAWPLKILDQKRTFQRTKPKLQRTMEGTVPGSHKDGIEPRNSGFWVRWNNWIRLWVFSFEELVHIDSGFIPETNWVGLEWGPRICISNKQVVYGPYFQKILIWVIMNLMYFTGKNLSSWIYQLFIFASKGLYFCTREIYTYKFTCLVFLAFLLLLLNL